jgi:hypothetical protein
VTNSKTISETIEVNDSIAAQIIPYLRILSDVEELKVLIGLESLNVNAGILKETS